MVGLNSDDIDADFARLKDAGVEFIEEPTKYDGLRIATLRTRRGTSCSCSSRSNNRQQRARKRVYPP